MTNPRHRFLDLLPDTAAALRACGGVLTGKAAAHVHLAVATRSRPGEPPNHTALPPDEITAIFSQDGATIPGVEEDRSAVARVVTPRLDLFAEVVRLADDTAVPVVRREVAIAQLLERAGMSIALAGKLLYTSTDPPIDIDEVRELLKAARCGERFQPLLELVALRA